MKFTSTLLVQYVLLSSLMRTSPACSRLSATCYGRADVVFVVEDNTEKESSKSKQAKGIVKKVIGSLAIGTDAYLFAYVELSNEIFPFAMLNGEYFVESIKKKYGKSINAQALVAAIDAANSSDSQLNLVESFKGMKTLHSKEHGGRSSEINIFVLLISGEHEAAKLEEDKLAEQIDALKKSSKPEMICVGINDAGFINVTMLKYFCPTHYIDKYNASQLTTGKISSISNTIVDKICNVTDGYSSANLLNFQIEPSLPVWGLIVVVMVLPIIAITTIVIVCKKSQSCRRRCGVKKERKRFKYAPS